MEIGHRSISIITQPAFTEHRSKEIIFFFVTIRNRIKEFLHPIMVGLKVINQFTLQNTAKKRRLQKNYRWDL
jgi:hypothetical protein